MGKGKGKNNDSMIAIRRIWSDAHFRHTRQQRRRSTNGSLIWVSLVAVLWAVWVESSAAAYNPPPGGVRLESFTSPAQMINGQSVAGGALFFASPSSIAVNPAIIGDEQRVTFDAGYTAMMSFGENFGSAFELGAMLPTPWCVGAVVLRGAFLPFDDMDNGNTMVGSFGLGKMVLQHLRIGASVSVGALWSAGWSYLVTAGLGAIYDVGDVGFLRDLRLAASVTDFGKTFSPDDIPGIDDDDEAGNFPVFCTPRAGAAVTLFSTSALTGGVSVDTYFPGLQDFVIALSYEMTIKEKWVVGVSQTLDIREAANGCMCAPAISAAYRMVLGGNGKYSGSDLAVSGAWQSMYGGVQALGAGAVMNLGPRDTEGPQIEISD